MAAADSSSSSSSSSSSNNKPGGSAPWEEMVQAWDPESMLAVEASTPPLDATGRTVTVAAFADALKRALEHQQQEPGPWGGDDDPFALEYLHDLSLGSPSCHPGGLDDAASCAAASSSSSSSTTTTRPGTATPDIFAAVAPAAAAATAVEQQQQQEGEEGENDDGLHSLALPPTPRPAVAPCASAVPATAAVMVRFPSSSPHDNDKDGGLKHAKQFLGPLACDAGLWASWGLPPPLWAAFQQAVNADPAALDAHAALLLQAATAAAASASGVVMEGEGPATAVLALPVGAARPAAALDVIVAFSSSTTTTTAEQELPSLLALLQSGALPPRFWAQYFHLTHQDHDMLARLDSGDVAAVYDFLCAYLLGNGSGVTTRHWEEAALTNGVKITLHPIIPCTTAAVPAAVEEVEASPLLLLHRGQSASLDVELDDGVVAAATGGYPLLPGLLGEDLEAQLGMLFDPPSLPPSPSPQPVSAAQQQQQPPRRGKELARLLKQQQQQQQQQQQEEEEEEEEDVGGGLRRSGRARRATAATYYAMDYESGSESEESESESASEEEEEQEKAPVAVAMVYPGRPEPAGKALADRGRHRCRVPGCAEEYRWPDYFCKVHGGGRCQYQWWDEGTPRCTKFHQSRNSNGELLCGEHSRATGACYGEQSRRAKSLKGKGKGKGKAAQAAKRGHAGASKRVVKRKEW